MRDFSSDARSPTYSADFELGVAARQAPHTMNERVTLAPHVVVQFGISKNRPKRGERSLHMFFS